MSWAVAGEEPWRPASAKGHGRADAGRLAGAARSKALCGPCHGPDARRPGERDAGAPQHLLRGLR